jgi:hypothetical protein
LRAYQPIDEVDCPASTWTRGRVPPSDGEIDHLFASWADALVDQRKYLTVSLDYMAASLWRRVGLRLNENLLLDLRDWRADRGEHGKLHVRFGKGSWGRGTKTRLVPGIDLVNGLLTWWLTVRHQSGDDWDDPDAAPAAQRAARPDDRSPDHGRGPTPSVPGWSARL